METTPFVSSSKSPSKSLKGLRWLIVILIILAILAIIYLVCYFYRQNYFLAGKTGNTWKAVFLTSGQVYFGKINSERAQTVVLREVYYLQQVPSTSNQNQEAPQLSLMKVGEELHGPTGEIRVNRSHILFIETLRTDSQIIKGIIARQEKTK